EMGRDYVCLGRPHQSTALYVWTLRQQSWQLHGQVLTEHAVEDLCGQVCFLEQAVGSGQKSDQARAIASLAAEEGYVAVLLGFGQVGKRKILQEPCNVRNELLVLRRPGVHVHRDDKVYGFFLTGVEKNW